MLATLLLVYARFQICRFLFLQLAPSQVIQFLLDETEKFQVGNSAASVACQPVALCTAIAAAGFCRSRCWSGICCWGLFADLKNPRSAQNPLTPESFCSAFPAAPFPAAMLCLFFCSHLSSASDVLLLHLLACSLRLYAFSD